MNKLGVISRYWANPKFCTVPEIIDWLIEAKDNNFSLMALCVKRVSEFFKELSYDKAVEYEKSIDNFAFSKMIFEGKNVQECLDSLSPGEKINYAIFVDRPYFWQQIILKDKAVLEYLKNLSCDDIIVICEKLITNLDLCNIILSTNNNLSPLDIINYSNEINNSSVWRMILEIEKVKKYLNELPPVDFIYIVKKINNEDLWQLFERNTKVQDYLSQE